MTGRPSSAAVQAAPRQCGRGEEQEEWLVGMMTSSSCLAQAALADNGRPRREAACE